mgnify:CR=1 FL=1
MIRSLIRGAGSAMPQRVVTNAELAGRLDTSDEWIVERTGIRLEQIDVIEANEAFAAQACAVMQELGMDPARVNPNGSGISLGHPVGATGAIISVKAIHELQRIGGRYALVTMCIGGGQGIAALFERC